MLDALEPLCRSEPQIRVRCEVLDHRLYLRVVGLLLIEQLLPGVEFPGLLKELRHGLIDGFDDLSDLIVLVDVLILVEAWDGSLHALNLLLEVLLVDLHLLHEVDFVFFEYDIPLLDLLEDLFGSTKHQPSLLNVFGWKLILKWFHEIIHLHTLIDILLRLEELDGHLIHVLFDVTQLLDVFGRFIDLQLDLLDIIIQLEGDGFCSFSYQINETLTQEQVFTSQ